LAFLSLVTGSAEATMKSIAHLLLCLILGSACLAAEKPDAPKPAQSIDELQKQIEKILKDTHTPGVSIAIVQGAAPEFIGAIGLADVTANRPATAETLFRIGSTSKAFSGLAILKLVNEGKLSLDDPIKKLIPEIWFENRWEETDPIRVVNLLEHTTGWDDMSLRQYAKEDPNLSLKDALDFGKDTRISRWPPGTRMSYCNTGPAVVAYIVEKITGQGFEEYVQKNFFDPIGMKTATYMPPKNSLEAATLYHDDGKTPYPYWYVMYRPAGSINASAKDMAAYVHFYLNRGNINGAEILPAASLDRMEVAESTWAAKDGLKASYGIYNYWAVHDGFVFHGHNGGVSGGLTEMAYIPDAGVGYSFSINSGSVSAYQQIGDCIRAYLTRTMAKPAVPAPATMAANASDYDGWYAMDSSRQQLVHFLDRLMLNRFHVDGDKLRMSSLQGSQEFIPVDGLQFRRVDKKKAPDPVPTLVLLSTNSDGRFIQLGMQSTLVRMPSWLAIVQILLTGFVLLAMLAILLYAPFWICGGLSKKRRRPAERAMRLLPLISVLSLLCFILLFSIASDDLIPKLGRITFWSATLWLLTLIFAVTSLASVFLWWRAPVQETRRSVRIFTGVVSAALLVATLYLAYWGIIGLRTWA
jgi:CubicO group peptidase (beta-lactamase class C family)